VVPVTDVHHPGDQEDAVDSVVDHDTIISYLQPIKAFQGNVNMISGVCCITHPVYTAHTSLDSSICQASIVCTVMGCEGMFQICMWM